MVLLITVAFAVVFATFDLLVEAQDPANQNANSNTKNSNAMRTRGSRRTGTKTNSKAAAATGVAQDQSTPTANEATPAMQTETKTGATSKKRRGRRTTVATDTTATATAQTEQTDLSGTYTGSFNCDDIGLTGATTLTINGNQFTTAEGKTGRIVASTTHGYTAVALQTGDTGTPTAGMPATTAPQIVSLRARKNGDRLTLMPVAGSTHACSFIPSRAVARKRSLRSPQAVPAAAGTEVTSPAEVGPTPADVTTPRTPARARTRRGNVRPVTGNTTVSPTTAPSPAAVPSTIPSESPAPVVTPSQSPLPSPTPSASPTPPAGPAPSASPTPTPSPTPGKG
jgi:hypothetical protein